MRKVKNRLKELRNKKHLTLQELGEQLGMPNNTLSQYETGKREPKLETWQKLADFFGVSVPYLQGISDIEDLEPVSTFEKFFASLEKNPDDKKAKIALDEIKKIISSYLGLDYYDFDDEPKA